MLLKEMALYGRRVVHSYQAKHMTFINHKKYADYHHPEGDSKMRKKIK